MSHVNEENKASFNAYHVDYQTICLEKNISRTEKLNDFLQHKLARISIMVIYNSFTDKWIIFLDDATKYTKKILPLLPRISIVAIERIVPCHP